MNEKTIEIKRLTKLYKGMRVIKNINLSVGKGKIYGLIGSDNSRKSLLIKMLLGLVNPGSGEILFCGERINRDSTNHLAKIGVLIDEIGFYENLSGYENIRLYLKPYHKRISKLISSDFMTIEDRIKKAFKQFNMISEMDIPVKKYSLGLKQRLRLIRVFVIEPEIIILDEPTKSLDPVILKVLKEALMKLANEKNTTIFIATAMLNFIEEIADEIGLLHYGEIIDEITKEELMVNQKAYLQIVSDNIPKTIFVLERELSIFDYEVVNDYTLRILNKYEPSHEIIKMLVKNDITIKEVKYGSYSLESYFLARIGD